MSDYNLSDPPHPNSWRKWSTLWQETANWPGPGEKKNVCWRSSIFPEREQCTVAWNLIDWLWVSSDNQVIKPLSISKLKVNKIKRQIPKCVCKGVYANEYSQFWQKRELSVHLINATKRQHLKINPSPLETQCIFFYVRRRWRPTFLKFLSTLFFALLPRIFESSG